MVLLGGAFLYNAVRRRQARRPPARPFRRRRPACSLASRRSSWAWASSAWAWSGRSATWAGSTPLDTLHRWWPLLLVIWGALEILVSVSRRVGAEDAMKASKILLLLVILAFGGFIEAARVVRAARGPRPHRLPGAGRQVLRALVHLRVGAAHVPCRRAPPSTCENAFGAVRVSRGRAGRGAAQAAHGRLPRHRGGGARLLRARAGRPPSWRARRCAWSTNREELERARRPRGVRDAPRADRAPGHGGDRAQRTRRGGRGRRGGGRRVGLVRRDPPGARGRPAVREGQTRRGLGLRRAGRAVAPRPPRATWRWRTWPTAPASTRSTARSPSRRTGALTVDSAARRRGRRDRARRPGAPRAARRACRRAT